MTAALTHLKYCEITLETTFVHSFSPILHLSPWQLCMMKITWCIWKFQNSRWVDFSGKIISASSWWEFPPASLLSSVFHDLSGARFSITALYGRQRCVCVRVHMLLQTQNTNKTVACSSLCCSIESLKGKNKVHLTDLVLSVIGCLIMLLWRKMLFGHVITYVNPLMDGFPAQFY